MQEAEATRSYVALLRGINVSGHNMIKMADLRQLCQQIGLQQVQTYIQSGNILFEAEERAEPLRQRIEAVITATFGYTVPVLLRTAPEMEQIVKDCPFDTAGLAEGESIYVTLLAAAPTPEAVAGLPRHSGELDEYRILGREVYILCRQPYHKSKLTNQFFEQKLGVPATSRNWRTITTLATWPATATR